jgi:hypothetical protein
MLPPDLHEPFASAEARSHAAQQLLERYQLLEELQRLAALPSDQWPQEQIERFPSSTEGHTKQSAERLDRWRALFAGELRQVRDTRNSAAHGRISDVELRTAVYLAERLLAAAYGRSLPNETPPDVTEY